MSSRRLGSVGRQHPQPGTGRGPVGAESSSPSGRRARAGRPWRVALVCGCLVAFGPAALGAVDFTVNSVVDAVDAAPGNGVCATAGGVCTLRAAVMEANALAGSDRVLLGAQTYFLTLVGAGDGAGDLDLTSVIEIAGIPGTRISAAAGLDCVLEVSAGTATVHDVTLQPLGSTANPSCILATAPLLATNVSCSPPLFANGFESGDCSAWSARYP